MNGQIDEVFVTDRVLTVQQVCRICACGIDGKRCSCSAEVNHETEYAACNSNADCIPPYGICDPTSDKCTGWQHPQQVVCWGGSNAGNLCTVGSECPGGTCYGAPTCGGCTLPDCNAPTPAPQPTATETATATPTATVTPNSTPTVTVTPNPTSTASPSPALDWVSGAVAVWRFEADLTDETGDSNNTLTYDSTPTPAPGRTPNWTGPVQQGFELYQALLQKGVPARLLYFNDENHWVHKPGNSLVWYREVQAWLDKYAGTGTPAAP